MPAVPIAIVVMVPIVVVVVIEGPVAVFCRAIIATPMFMFFHFTPGCHQQTGQAE